MDSLAAQFDLDQAIASYRQQRYADARSLLHDIVSADPANATAWDVLGYVERDIGDTAAAAAAFDRALAVQPGDAIAIKGRARMALERAERDVLDRYAVALARSRDDPQLVLEQTEARLAEGESSAIDDFATFAERLPGWTEGQVALARMLWETRRDEAFTGRIERLLTREPGRADLWWQLAQLLMECGFYQKAADVARKARRLVNDNGEFALLEAVNAGRAGDLERAGAALSSVPQAFPKRAVADSVHHIRLGKLDVAKTYIESALREDPLDISSWGIAELIYRAVGDSRSVWLSGQEGLVRTFDLQLDPDRLEAIKRLLLQLHRFGVEVAGQTVRGGTQTRWRLFERTEPELAGLRQAVETAINEYVEELPPHDPDHPLLRHRDAPLTITGSWSVRLTGGGHHVSHIHPLGLIGSACYFQVPDSPGEGQLELGRPSEDMKLDLEPIHVIPSQPGRLVLFPSYLHHGTTKFSAGERLSVAFDVHRHPAPRA